jgi:hypothetical protein
MIPDGQENIRRLRARISEETLMKTWDNDADDVFNELLRK